MDFLLILLRQWNTKSIMCSLLQQCSPRLCFYWWRLVRSFRSLFDYGVGGGGFSQMFFYFRCSPSWMALELLGRAPFIFHLKVIHYAYNFTNILPLPADSDVHVDQCDVYMYRFMLNKNKYNGGGDEYDDGPRRRLRR